MTRAYNINKETEEGRVAKRFWNEPNKARQNALEDILAILAKTNNLRDAAYLVRAEYKTCKARIEAERKQTTVSRHVIENDQTMAVVYRDFYRRFVED